MDKRSPLAWNATPKVEAFNYKYTRPQSAVKVFDDKSPSRQVPSRCSPHTNINPFPLVPPEEDYSWVRTAPNVARNLPESHPLSPARLREAERERRRAELGDDYDSDTVTKSDRKSQATSFSKDNPNNSSFSMGGKSGGKNRGKFGGDKRDSAFGEVDKFTAHKAGGHFSSKTKSLLEITRKDEIDLQKQRDVAEAKAKLVLGGQKLV
jgi:hypothetical protein